MKDIVVEMRRDCNLLCPVVTLHRDLPGNIALSIELTDPELDFAYRAQKLKYDMEDAENHLEEFLQGHDVPYSVSLFEDHDHEARFYADAAEAYGELVNPGITQNAAWEEAIQNTVRKTFVPGWINQLKEKTATQSREMCEYLDEKAYNGTPAEADLVDWLDDFPPMWAVIGLMNRFCWNEE